jgi:nucleoside-diphosphate-sugar epimerase
MSDKVLLVGGKGAIGSRLSPLLKLCGYACKSYDRASAIRYKQKLPCGYDAYIWLATTHHNRDETGRVLHDFVEDIRMYEEYIKENATSLVNKKHIYFSSSHVYPLACGSVTAYGEYKRRVEGLLMSAFSRLIVLRPFFVIDAFRNHSTQSRIITGALKRCSSQPIWYSDIMLLYAYVRKALTLDVPTTLDVRYDIRRTLCDIYGITLPEDLSESLNYVKPN